MGLFDFLSPLATTATQAVGAQRAGQTAANARVTDDAFERAKLLMAMRNQQSTLDVNAANRGEMLARTAALQNPKPQRTVKELADGSLVAIDKSTGTAIPVQYGQPGATPGATQQGGVEIPPQGPSTGAAVMPPISSARIAAPPPQALKALVPTKPPVVGSPEWNDAQRFKAGLTKQPADHYTFPTGVDAQGNPVIMRANTRTGDIAPSGQDAKTGVGGGGSASAQSQQARLMAAVAEARLADGRMRTFEDSLLSGKKQINPLEQTGGTLMTNLSGSHSAPGALTQAFSELALSKTDPEYAQYLRDAATIGRAEQMMSPRGGNETMVRANALLSRAGTGAMKNTIDASRMARQALFGQSGGVEQTLTPTQSAKLKAGVAKIQAGDTGAPTLDRATWVQANPPKPGESQDAYIKRATAAAGASGNISLGPTPPQRDMATWAAKNPPKPGESRDAYRARYQAGGG